MRAAILPTILKVCLLLVLSLALFSWDGAAKATDHLSEQLIPAAEQGDVEQVKLLLEKGAHINNRDGRGWLPLIRATYSANLAMIRFLVENGADINSKDRQGETALKAAVAVNNLDVAEFLLAKGANINARNSLGFTALHKAVSEGDSRTRIVKLLLDNGADVNEGLNGLMQSYHFSFVRPFHEVARILVHRGADVNRRLKDPWSPPWDTDYQTLLIWAMRWAADLVEEIIDKGADLNATDSRGATALMHAVMNRNSQMVELLLKKGANVDARDNYGKTALTMAVELYRTDRTVIADLLKAHGAKE